MFRKKTRSYYCLVAGREASVVDIKLVRKVAVPYATYDFTLVLVACISLHSFLNSVAVTTPCTIKWNRYLIRTNS